MTTIWAVEIERTEASGPVLVLADDEDEACQIAATATRSLGRSFMWEEVEWISSGSEIPVDKLTDRAIIYAGWDEELTLEKALTLVTPTDPKAPTPGQIDIFGGVVQ